VTEHKDRCLIEDAKPRRIDLHCHSCASNEADEAMLNAIKCPESYSTPEQVYDQAKLRGMDLVTITDHDSLNGVATLLSRGDVLAGEELTCYFPEDRCKMHVLIWGITPEQHDELQAVANDIYQVASIIERRGIAHAVAHPVYRQNDLLERWHLERLMLLFKGFETLNGAHSALHRDSLEPLLNQLTREKIDELSSAHRLLPLWPEPWIKARTGGSDDHGLFNIGRTWTEFPADAGTVVEILDCIRTARCRPGGEAGSSLKLAHNFFSVGIKYFGRQFLPQGSKPTLTTGVMQMLVGEKNRIRKRDLVKYVIKKKAGKIGRAMVKPFRRKPAPKSGVALLAELFANSCRARIGEHPRLTGAMRQGVAPLGEHQAMFDFVSAINRDLAGGIYSSVQSALKDGRVAGIFDALSSVAAHQFVLLPYYFALSHQNREKNDLSRITGHGRRKTAESLRVGVFTDTFDDVNGVVRFIRDMGHQATRKERTLIVHTCSETTTFDAPYRKNFKPLVSREMPMYPQLKIVIPPLVDIMEWADRQQFDAIHVDTPGPMGLCGWLVAKMLRVPLLGTYHTDFPEYIRTLSGGDFRLTAATAGYMGWFYGQMSAVLSRSRQYHAKLRGLGVDESKFAMAHPCVDDDRFNPRHRDVNLWERYNIRETHRLFFCGRISEEKNLPLLADIFKELCARRRDVALVLAGEGPYTGKLKEKLAGLPVYFVGVQNDAGLAPLYASSDLFIFPSRTDTLGQVIMEAQASGLPVLVSDEGGPKEVVDDGLTGRILSVADPVAAAAVWAGAIEELLNDEPRRQRLSRTAATRMARYTAEATFDAFW
jgi:glycosyltransferase involved in cell wall biosynthesis